MESEKDTPGSVQGKHCDRSIYTWFNENQEPKYCIGAQKMYIGH